MAKRTRKRNNVNRKFRDEVFGLVLIAFALVLVVSLIFHYATDNSLTTASAEPTKNLLGTLGAYFSDIFTQAFGLFSYFISLLCLVWGINFVSGKIHYIKRKFLTFSVFLLLGSLSFNIASTYPFFEKLISKIGIDYYAGGFVGYVFSKLVFIDLLEQSTSACRWVFWGLFVMWLFVAKRALFVEFDFVFNNLPAIFKALRSVVKLKRKKPDKPDAVWDTQTEDTSPEIGEALQQDEVDSTANEMDISNFVMGNGTYVLPSVDLLDKHSEKEVSQDEGKIAVMSAELLNVLEEFGVQGEILNVRQGPVVTMFEFRPAPGIKTSRVISLSDDIARSMSAISARISNIPGQNAIGIELPNKNRHTVYLKELLNSEAFYRMSTGIPIILGKDISGNPVMADLAKMPHLLVAGTTGSGKSVSINDMILSILFKFSPKDCKLIMIDPKMLELSVYDEIPHLLTPVVTDPKKAVFALKWAVTEMESRYRQMSKLGVRNIDGFNKKLTDSKESGDLMVRKVQTGFDQETGRPIFETQQIEFEPLPYIVIIVDEMADLMLVAGKEVEAAIQRLAQMARAAGIHLIMATQRPSVDVITGTIKANFPTRISFQVTSKIDSRTILGEQGAEQLLGQGDMLYMSGAGRILRVHGPFVKDSEVERIVSYVKGQGEPEYVDVVSDQFGDDFGSSGEGGDGDDMYRKAVEIVVNDKKCSISYIQRKLQIGYNRAARIVEEMEEKGVLSAPNHTGKREILI
ncbi:MAG: DNA translocase FtsK 4TM domain-containing protein [Alphaproteobacteria bacterium]|nr:DNA translocase FtsK 4TM domain-containing protein [Alphaproteobacteria bacterium]